MPVAYGTQGFVVEPRAFVLVVTLPLTSVVVVINFPPLFCNPEPPWLIVTLVATGLKANDTGLIIWLVVTCVTAVAYPGSLTVTV